MVSSFCILFWQLSSFVALKVARGRCWHVDVRIIHLLPQLRESRTRTQQCHCITVHCLYIYFLFVQYSTVPGTGIIRFLAGSLNNSSARPPAIFYFSSGPRVRPEPPSSSFACSALASASSCGSRGDGTRIASWYVRRICVAAACERL